MKKINYLAVAALCFSLMLTTAVVANAQVIPGCFPGNAYSTQNGQVCTSTSLDTGCSVGNTYSTVTGAACVNVAQSTTVIPTPGLPNTGAEPVVMSIAVAIVAALSALTIGRVLMVTKRAY